MDQPLDVMGENIEAMGRWFDLSLHAQVQASGYKASEERVLLCLEVCKQLRSLGSYLYN